MRMDNAITEINGIPLAENQCPRCLGMIPNNDQPGAYSGALSRLTRTPDTEPMFVCSACGVDEAMGTGYVPINLWPIALSTTPAERSAE